MTEIVSADRIEQIVGARRHPTHHLGRAVSAAQSVFILHSSACVDSGLDLRACSYSAALDLGIDTAEWVQDTTVSLVIQGGQLVPLDFLPPDVELLSDATCTCGSPDAFAMAVNEVIVHRTGSPCTIETVAGAAAAMGGEDRG